MVDGVGRLHAQFAKVPDLVREEVTKAIAKICEEIVRDMKSLAPFPEMAAGVDWTWGEAPAGSMKVASFSGNEYARVSATIFVNPKTAEYPHGLPMMGNWFEFGTSLRVQKKTGREVGQITAQPFFWPAVRSGKRTFPNRIRAALKRAMKRANAA